METYSMKTILVAEDNDSNFMLMNYILRQHYAVKRAHDGKEVVEMAGRGGIDMILMDLKMPMIDGLEATRIITADNPDIPIIMLTANAFEADRQAAVEAGCVDFLSKPINSKICLDTVEKYINR